MKFILKKPVDPFVISQQFGVNGEYYRANGINVAGHNGLDLVAKHGQVVCASHDGIAYWESDEKQGEGVVIVTNEQFEYKGEQVFFKSIYWHFVADRSLLLKLPLADKMNGVQGYSVKTGDPIGYADSTGFSTGDHLHYGLKPMYGRSPFEGLNVEQANGYLGAIDPIPFIDNKPEHLKHIFGTDLKFGQTSPEVMELQKRLQELGFFPAATTPTNYYGNVTRAAVFAFQRKYLSPLSTWNSIIVWLNLGSYCSTLTRAALNNL